MRLPQHISLIDLCVAALVLVVLVLPSRSSEAVAALSAGDAVAVSRAEAKTWANPGDGKAAADLARSLARAGEYDWATDAATVLAKGQSESPTRWRAMLAVSIGHADRLEAEVALHWAELALAACGEVGDACPAWEEVRVQLYTNHLAAGVRSGIDPRVDPIGFRRAAEASSGMIHLSGGLVREPEPTPVPAPGSGSGASTP